MPNRKRIIETVERSAAGKEKIPRLPQIHLVLAAEKTGLVVADRFVETVVVERRLGIGIVEIYDACLRHQRAHRKVKIAVVLRDQVFVRQRGLFILNPLRYLSLPRD